MARKWCMYTTCAGLDAKGCKKKGLVRTKTHSIFFNPTVLCTLDKPFQRAAGFSRANVEGSEGLTELHLLLIYEPHNR